MTSRFEDVYAALPTNGWLSEREARCLWSAALMTRGAILEIGCYYGRASALLAALGRPLYCVDPFAGFDSNFPDGDEVERAWRANMGDRGHAVRDGMAAEVSLDLVRRVTLYRQRVEDWEPLPCDFVYCDGDHTSAGTKVQVRVALACGAKIIGVHDVNDDGEGEIVKNAAVGLLGPWSWRTERLAVWEVKR